ncbi:MAG TPA: sigma-70 family RNA polymerase sigma factor [Usitatibacter sp.]|nr:sigma-70 family RNA polymerase sigma factor [Usitatibacter sp.]
MNKDPDEALVERCRQGDRAALGTLMRRYQRAIYNAAYRVLGNGEDAADVAQSVFLKVAERLDEFDAERRFFSWIYRIAINEALNVLRRKDHEEPLDAEDELPGAESLDPERIALAAQLAGRVQHALMSLRFDDRIVITLRHFSGCSYGEIATILELQEKTVKSRLFDARTRLRGLLRDLQPA